LLVPAIVMLSARRIQFLAVFVLPPAEFSRREVTGGHGPAPVYVWTAPGPDVRGGLSYILLSVTSGCSGPRVKGWSMAVYFPSSPLA
jgi:hypothetical protein